MATATNDPRAARESTRRARSVRVPEATQFVTFQDNGGAYHWMLVAGDGVPLAQSGSFASYVDAEQAVRRVRDGVASARVARRGDDVGPVDQRDDRDAERWLAEDGSCSSELVKR